MSYFKKSNSKRFHCDFRWHNFAFKGLQNAFFAQGEGDSYFLRISEPNPAPAPHPWQISAYASGERDWHGSRGILCCSLYIRDFAHDLEQWFPTGGKFPPGGKFRDSRGEILYSSILKSFVQDFSRCGYFQFTNPIGERGCKSGGNDVNLYPSRIDVEEGRVRLKISGKSCLTLVK